MVNVVIVDCTHDYCIWVLRSVELVQEFLDGFLARPCACKFNRIEISCVLRSIRKQIMRLLNFHGWHFFEYAILYQPMADAANFDQSRLTVGPEMYHPLDGDPFTPQRAQSLHVQRLGA